MKKEELFKDMRQKEEELNNKLVTKFGTTLLNKYIAICKAIHSEKNEKAKIKIQATLEFLLADNTDTVSVANYNNRNSIEFCNLNTFNTLKELNEIIADEIEDNSNVDVKYYYDELMILIENGDGYSISKSYEEDNTPNLNYKKWSEEEVNEIRNSLTDEVNYIY